MPQAEAYPVCLGNKTSSLSLSLYMLVAIKTMHAVFILEKAIKLFSNQILLTRHLMEVNAYHVLIVKRVVHLS